MKTNFDSVNINMEDKTFEILDGTCGIYYLSEIEKCSVLNEQASYRGKTSPFKHQMLGGAAFMTPVDPKMYVGISIFMKDGKKLAIYTSKTPVLFHSQLYFDDKKEADSICKLLELHRA